MGRGGGGERLAGDTPEKSDIKGASTNKAKFFFSFFFLFSSFAFLFFLADLTHLIYPIIERRRYGTREERDRKLKDTNTRGDPY